MNAVVGLPHVDTAELIFPRNPKIKTLIEALNSQGFIVCSENHIALCIVVAKIQDLTAIKTIRYTPCGICIQTDCRTYRVKNEAVRMVAKSMKRFVVTNELRYCARKLLYGLLDQEKVILFVNSKPSIPSIPMICISNLSDRRNGISLLKHADKVVTYDEFLRDPGLIIRSCMRSMQTVVSQSNVQNTHRYTPTTAYKKTEFPRHDLMQAAKQVTKKVVAKLVREERWQLDKLDLEYQTLFRLTTMPASQIVPGVQKVVDYEPRDVLNDSKVVGYYNSLGIKAQHIDTALIEQIAREQSRVILNRLKKSSLPMELFLKDANLSENDRPTLLKTQHGLCSVDKQGHKRKVIFKEVDLSLARQIHNDLHYIHTPRADFAFGLFYADDTYPFSVVALERIDRDYKVMALALFGYDASNCLDFTRLYSRPGGPKNASSVIFRELKLRLRDIMPNIQAGISTHMPSYTHGNSMLAGGFDKPFLIKPSVHSFGSVELDGEVCYEMLTNRRLDTVAKEREILQSHLPLAPIVEVIAPFNHPRIEPYFEIGKTMLVKGA